MKVTIPEITDRELAELLKSSGITDDEIKSFLRRCEKALLDSIHEKQAVLDKLVDLIWCMEHERSSV